jgi:Uma2 family endonuclease
METLVLEMSSAYELERNKPMPSKLHSIVQMNIGFELKTLYPSQFDVFSELTLDFAEGDVVPDICLFPKGTLSFAEDEVRITTAPVLAIEILSPTQNLQELLTKSKAYFQNGVQSYWLVIPSMRLIHVFSSIQDYETYKKQDRLKDPLVNIEIDLSKIFPL